MELLKEIDLYSKEIENEADNLSTYWNLENRLILTEEINPEMLQTAIRLRPSDVYMLHAIFQKITGISFSTQTQKAIILLEEIRDIEADLRQYENDVKNNDFNIYRMFIKLHQKEAQDRLQYELDQRKMLYAEIIDQLPLPFQEKFIELTRCYYKERPPIQVPPPIK